MTGGSYAVERAEKKVAWGRHHREFCAAGCGERALFFRAAPDREARRRVAGGGTIAIFFKTVRAGGRRACDEKHRKEAQKGAKTLAKPPPGGQKQPKRVPKPSENLPREVQGGSWDPSGPPLRKRTRIKQE